MITEVSNGVYSLEIALPDNPLKYLNCYIIKGKNGGRNLILDSGFRREECLKTLLDGLEELGLDPQNTDVFFTHLHADHCGNGDTLQQMGCRIFMGEIDYKIMLHSRLGGTWQSRAKHMGLPAEDAEKIMDNNPAIIYAAKSFTATTVADGEVLRYGGRELECVLTPGHTPGHICLFDRKNKLLFSGDHILFDITPNIVSWVGYPDALGQYLQSLEKVRRLNVETVLPAHRTTGGVTLYERVGELERHHSERLSEALRIAREHPGAGAYELAGLMTWRIRARNWEEFPPGQKWFAVGECMAHMERLVEMGFLRSEEQPDTSLRYYPL